MSTRRLLRDAPGIGCHPPPEPRDLRAAPELAILAVLDDVLETALATILAANPQRSRPCGLDRSAAAAHRITLGEARHLEKPIDTRDST